MTNSTVPANMATRYKLLNQMLTAGLANSVTIFPMSRGNCTDYDNSLVANFPAFAEWADQQLNPSTNTWMISGHSGAGRALANIAATFKDFTKRVEISTLLDAAYSMGSYIGRWQVGAGSNRRMKIRSFYATSSPEAGSIQLQNTIPAQAKAVRSKSYGDHCNVPMTDFGDALKDSSAANLDIAADSVSF